MKDIYIYVAWTDSLEYSSHLMGLLSLKCLVCIYSEGDGTTVAAVCMEPIATN